MAEMIPESVPSGRPLSERRVFDILQKLPNDHIVYYEPVVANRYPDFLVISPHLGLMVIEVKGWHPAQIERADHHSVVLSIGGQIQKVLHPLEQARAYMFKLMNTCKEDSGYSSIRQTSGAYAGSFVFPFGHLAVLANITTEQLDQTGLRAVFPASRVIAKNEIESWEQMDPSAITERLRTFFDPFWQFPRLTSRQVDVLRAVIHPEIIVRRKTAVASAPTSPVSPEQPISGQVSELQVLDKDQELLARKIGDGHRVVNGVAGSGKTILLIHRARWLSTEDPNRRILVLCFNRSLGAYLKDCLIDRPNVTVHSFHKWGASMKAQQNHNNSKFGLNVLAKVSGLSDEGKYDAIFIDEAQDFDKSWLDCAVAAMRDPENGDLIVVADGNQGLYRPQEFKWIDVGIKARGRVIPLYRNYRNTHQIVQIASCFASQSDGNAGDQIVGLKPKESLRNGPRPLAFKTGSRSDEMAYVVGIVKELLEGKWSGRQLSETIDPSDIAIIYPRKNKNVEKPFASLQEKFKQEGIPVVWLTKDADAKDLVSKAGLKIQTIHSCKGLQYKAVIFMWADLLPMKHWMDDVSEDERLMYVGLTRAETYLAVTYVGGSKFTERIEEALKQADSEFVFYCRECGHLQTAPRSLIPQGSLHPKIKCPKCEAKTTISIW